jgi:hypothetical protein
MYIISMINTQPNACGSLEFRAVELKDYWGHDICLTIDRNGPHAKK